jgi:hypothetical protein
MGEGLEIRRVQLRSSVLRWAEQRESGLELFVVPAVTPMGGRSGSIEVTRENYGGEFVLCDIAEKQEGRHMLLGENSSAVGQIATSRYEGRAVDGSCFSAPLTEGGPEVFGMRYSPRLGAERSSELSWVDAEGSRAEVRLSPSSGWRDISACTVRDAVQDEVCVDVDCRIPVGRQEEEEEVVLFGGVRFVLGQLWDSFQEVDHGCIDNIEVALLCRW